MDACPCITNWRDNTMKKILCVCVALILALGCMCAAAEEDLQAELDAANAKIAELQAQVDAYYPFYAAQILVTYGDDGVIWLEDIKAQYEAVAAQYASYGLDLAAYGMEESVKKDMIDTAVENAVILSKAEELGLTDYDETQMAEFESSAAAMVEEYTHYYIDYYYPDAEEITDEMQAESDAYWAANDMDYDSLLKTLMEDAAYSAVYNHVTADVAITEEDVEAAYQALIEANKASYSNDRTYNSDRTSGVAIAWNPENYRAVKHVLIMFNDEQAQLYSDLQSQLSSLNTEKEALENPSEETDTAAEGEENAESRTIEEINADIAACATEIEALYSQLMPTAEEVIAKFNDGADFQSLIDEYNADPGMQSGLSAEIGYAVTETDSSYWEQAFTDGAMSIANKGEISAPVYGSNGIHIIYYMDDIPAGEVALDEIRADVEEDALEDKLQTTYDDQISAWMEEMNVQYFYENYGITA